MLFKNHFVIQQTKILFLTIIFTLAILFVFSSSNNLFAAQAKITFNPVADSRVEGYKIYYGTSTHISNIIDIGSKSSHTIYNLEKGVTYYFAATSYDRYGNESKFSNIVDYEVPQETKENPPKIYYGSLKGIVDTPPRANFDLTAEGLDDWAHWGLNTASCLNRKKGVTQQIFYNPLGGRQHRFNDARVAYSWFDGTPTAGSNGTTTGIYFGGIGNGYEIRVPADVYSKTLKIYLGGFRAKGRFEASLSDGSVSPYIVDIENRYGAIDRVITLNFAASGQADLVITYILENDYRNGNITLQAVTLY